MLFRLCSFLFLAASNSPLPNPRYLALPCDIQSLKSSIQIQSYYQEVSSYFSFSPQDHLDELNDSNIFMILDKDTLIAYAQINIRTCYSQSLKKEYFYLNAYCVTVTDKYRNQGYSSKIFQYAIEYLTKRHKLDEDTILALHLSPNDPSMPLAALIYYKLGFRNGIFTKYGPSDYIYKIDDLMEKSRDLFYFSENPHKCNEEGYYFLLYCKLKDFNKRYQVPENGFEKTQNLFRVLTERKSSIV